MLWVIGCVSMVVSIMILVIKKKSQMVFTNKPHIWLIVNMTWMFELSGMLFGEHMNVNMNKSFLEYFANVKRILRRYYLTHGIYYLITWKNIMPCVHGWMIFMDENWELESQWTPKFSKSDCKGQNPLDWRISYIIGKPLDLKCLKWARMTYLST